MMMLSIDGDRRKYMIAPSAYLKMKIA